MPIYFPRGFNSGEPVRIVDGVTVVRGQLARQKVDLVVVAGSRGVLGGPDGVAKKETQKVLRAAGPATARELRALASRADTVQVLEPGKLKCRHLGFLEQRAAPAEPAELRLALSRVRECALALAAREVAIGPFVPDEAGARSMLSALREEHAAGAGGLRWILVLGERAQFALVTSAGGSSSPPPRPK